jgi:hypothetical protein
MAEIHFLFCQLRKVPSLSLVMPIFLSTSRYFTGKAEVTLVAGDELNESFTFDKQDQYKPVLKEFKYSGELKLYA